MTEKQQYLLQLFKEIDEICKKHNLRYVMAGGSLIGVVRNEGFIPWDDDVDIYMPREDWDKFVKLASEELPPDRAVQCVDVDRNYTNTFPRYASTDTCAIHRHQIIGKDKAGEIIDVLTLDPIPDDDREYEKYRTHLMIYSDLINIAVVYGNRYEVPVHLYLKYLFSYLFLGRDRTLKKLEKIMFSYKEEECSRYAMRWGGCPFLFDKDMMFPVKYGKFEGLDVMIPNKVSDYLIWHYGDEWSYIPSHGERESHDAVECYAVNYEEFRKEYMHGLDTFRLRKDAVLRKVYYMATAKRSHRLMRKRQELLGGVIAQEVLKKTEAQGETLESLLEIRNFQKLNQIFEEYFRVQLSADFIGREDFVHIYNFYHPYLINLEDNVFMAAMLTLFYSEKVSKAYRMLKVREQIGTLSTEMKELLNDILLFRSAACHYEFRENQEAESEIDELLRKYPENPSFLKFKTRFIAEKAKQKKNTEYLRGFLSKCTKRFPGDGYFLKYQGDMLWMEGKCKDALEVYADVRNQTSNGIVQLEIDKILEEHKMPAMQSCKSLIENGEIKEALELIELWKKLLPDDVVTDGYECLVQLICLKNQAEIKKILKTVENKILLHRSERTGEFRTEEISVYQEVYKRGMEMLGFSERLSEIYTELISTEKNDDLERLLKETLKSAEEGQLANVYLIAGEIRKKQGMTLKAFEYYKKGILPDASEYVKEKLGQIILNDLITGNRYVRSHSKKLDVSEFLDAWLGKYGSQKELRTMIKMLLLD